MLTFKPGKLPTDPAQLVPAVEKEFQRVQQAAATASDYLPLRYLTVAPARALDGLYLSEAGVLGASRGLYRYDSSTATYTFIA